MMVWFVTAGFCFMQHGAHPYGAPVRVLYWYGEGDGIQWYAWCPARCDALRIALIAALTSV